LTPEKLREWYQDKLEEMAREGGTDSYCGNWNACSGLRIVNHTFKNQAEADAYVERHAEKNGAVLALRVGDFSKVWPVTKAQQELQARVAKLEVEANEFDYRILERAQAQKSKKKTCSHCESSVNVRAIHKPALSELRRTNGYFDGHMFFVRGRHMMTSLFGMTDCPVCCRNLLKTDTDVKNEESLKKRLAEALKKVQESQAAFARENAGKPQPFWYVYGECGD
jgi:DNA repair exonuclease SbcCD ATPase subunit